MKIVITGATGFIGSRLVTKLQPERSPRYVLTGAVAPSADGTKTTYQNEVVILSRNPQAAKQQFDDLEVLGYTPADLDRAIDGCDAVINLAGAPIAERRWTKDYQQEILESRKTITTQLVEAIERAAVKPKVMVSASAIGYYGTSETAQLDENSPPGDDFLARVCQEWEQAAQLVTNSGTRLVIFRLGIVLGNGGALGKMLAPFKSYMGGPIGSGNQWFSWIHCDDVVQAIEMAITNSAMAGAYNLTAPHPVRMKEFAQVLGEVLNRPSWIPVPGFAMQALLGEGAMVVLEGQQVIPQRAIDLPFPFEYPELKPALASIVS
jgi:uncharacterized protein